MLVHRPRRWANDNIVVHEGRFYINPANTKHLYNICTMLEQRRRRWADVVQMVYKCFVFAEKERPRIEFRRMKK